VDPRAHDLQELTDVDALLDVVGEMEVRVVEVVTRGARGRRRLTRAQAERREGKCEHHREPLGNLHLRVLFLHRAARRR
jgi:hypothetical protein